MMEYVPKAIRFDVFAHMTNPPKPIGFGVVVDGVTVCMLDYDIVKTAVTRYETMLAQYEKHLNP